MRNFVRFILPLAVIALSIVMVAVMVKVAASKRPERKETGPQAVLVDTVVAEARSLNFVINSQGPVEPRTRTVLVAEVPGRILEVSPNFVAGGFFRAGDTLLQIDPSDYLTALKGAEANLASRRARLAEELARSEQALKDWQNLGRSGQIPELVARKPQLADAQANVLAAEADLERARRNLERTRISLPYDGLVREKRVDVGQFVGAGVQLGETFSVATAEVRLPLTPADLEFLDLPSAMGEPAGDFPPVSLAAEVGGQTHTWEARLIRTEGVLDESSRVLYGVAEVVDPYGVLGTGRAQQLRMGTFVRAAIEGRYVDNIVVLPRYLLRNDGTVLVANQERELEVREVKVVRAEPELVYISSGVRAGERVITTTLDAPIPGTRLLISGESETP